jgi:DNA repair exonuclease SbcCD ATPase subunit
MRTRSLGIMLIPITTLLMLVSCSRLPEDKVQTVTDSFHKLEDMKAKDYAPEAFKKAEDAYADAMEEIELQDEKFVLTRSYSKANDLLAKASEAVEQAKAKTEDGREEMQQEVATVLEDTKVNVKSAEDQLDKLKTKSAEITRIRDSFEETSGALKEAEQAFDSGDFLNAQSKANDAKALSEEVLVDIGRVHGR